MATITVNTATVKRLVKALVEAEIANSWKGGGFPEDIPAIEFNLKLARDQFNEYLKPCKENAR